MGPQLPGSRLPPVQVALHGKRSAHNVGCSPIFFDTGLSGGNTEERGIEDKKGRTKDKTRSGGKETRQHTHTHTRTLTPHPTHTPDTTDTTDTDTLPMYSVF